MSSTEWSLTDQLSVCLTLRSRDAEKSVSATAVAWSLSSQCTFFTWSFHWPKKHIFLPTSAEFSSLVMLLFIGRLFSTGSIWVSPPALSASYQRTHLVISVHWKHMGHSDVEMLPQLVQRSLKQLGWKSLGFFSANTMRLRCAITKCKFHEIIYPMIV